MQRSTPDRPQHCNSECDDVARLDAARAELRGLYQQFLAAERDGSRDWQDELLPAMARLHVELGALELKLAPPRRGAEALSPEEAASRGLFVLVQSMALSMPPTQAARRSRLAANDVGWDS